MMRPSLRFRLRAALAGLTLQDVVFLVGLLIATWGGVELSKPWTRVGVGVLLVLLSLRSFFRGSP